MKTRGYNRRRLVLFACGLVALLAFGAHMLHSTQDSNPGTGTLQTAVAMRRTIESTVLATGVIKPKTGAEVKVGSQVSGVVQHLAVNIGDRVRRGSLLAQLNPGEYEARFKEACAEYSAKETLARYAGIDLRRQERLFREHVVPESEFEAAQRAFEVASAQVLQAEGARQFDSIQLARTKILSPIAGVVASIATQEGETVVAGLAAPTFLTVLDLSKLEVWAYVDETDIGKIQTGQSATFTVDTFTDTEFDGRVTAIYPKPVIQENVVDYVAVTEITNTRGKTLRPEMTTTVRIAQERRSGVLGVPLNAVQREDGIPYVVVLRQDSREKRPVKTGARDKSFMEITEGLAEGECVLLLDAE